MQWKIDLLGGLHLHGAGEVIERFRTQKTASLLAYLAYHLDRAHPREALADLLWPDSEGSAARHSLSMAISSLRRQLEAQGMPPGSVLIADRLSVRLNPASVSTDVARFEAARGGAAQAASLAQQEQCLADAVALYQGPLLAGYYEEWIFPERARLEALYLQAVFSLIRCREGSGDLPGALECAHRALVVDPLLEEAHGEVIRLCAQLGQREAALRHYQSLVALLERELGTVPSRGIVALVQRLQRGEQATGPAQPRAEPARLPSRRSASPPPLGTATVLRADLAGVAAFRAGAADECRALLRREMERHGAVEVNESNGTFTGVFLRACDGVACAIACQQAMPSLPGAGPAAVPLLRIALHTGDVRGGPVGPSGDAGVAGSNEREVGQFGSRLLLAGHRGQILASEETAILVRRRLKPGTRLLDLGRYRLASERDAVRIFQVVDDTVPRREFPPLNAAKGYVCTLPPQMTRFFGRERETVCLSECLLSSDTRLVTLTGTGGSGKTRLALQAAERVMGELPGGVWFVPLAALSDARQIPNLVRECLGIDPVPGVDVLEQIAGHLEEQRAVLLLDNFEQLLPEGAPVVSHLLTRVPSLTCLVTSRRPLGLPGERQVPVAPLPVPADDENPARLLECPSVRLFADRAQAVRPDFRITEANQAAVAELCARLEGIPLALELVAARAQVLSPAQILARLGERLDWRARRASGGDRHRTLRAAIDWSYRLLPPELRRIYARLSVFRGGWSDEAAAAVEGADPAGDGAGVLDALARLHSHSLIGLEEQGGETRFRMLETLREHALERLAASGDEEEVRRRHAEYFLRLAEEAEPHLPGTRVASAKGVQDAAGAAGLRRWLARLDAEHGNLHAALTWWLAQGPESALRLASALFPYWEIRGNYAEGHRWMCRALAASGGAPPALRAQVARDAGRFAALHGDMDRARPLLEDAVAIYRQLGDRQGEVMTLLWLLNPLLAAGDFGAVHAVARAAVRASRELGDDALLARSLQALGKGLLDAGEYAGAAEALEEGIRIARDLGDIGILTWLLAARGHAFYRQGDLQGARGPLEEGLEMARAVGETYTTLFAHLGLGHVALAQGEFAQAGAHYAASTSLLMGSHAYISVASIPECFAYLSAARGELERAARLLGAAEKLRQELGYPLPVSAARDQEQALARIHDGLPEAAVAGAWVEGRALSLEETVAYALRWQSGGAEQRQNG